jgi:arylsulfatase
LAAVTACPWFQAFRISFQWDEMFDVGMDTGTGVAFLEYRYDVPFRFTGKLEKLTFNLEPQQLTAEDRRVMQAMGQRNTRASE